MTIVSIGSRIKPSVAVTRRPRAELFQKEARNGPGGLSSRSERFTMALLGSCKKRWFAFAGKANHLSV
jgi:hypothetical protein